MSIRILLVDDHKMMREGLRSILSDEEVTVIGEAENGREAIAMVQQLAPDIVVMDIGMHEMNGIEATRQIKARNPRTRVIVLSTYADKRSVLGPSRPAPAVMCSRLAPSTS